MDIIVKKSDCLRDWYTIERKHHDGRIWWKQIGNNCQSLRMSCRLSPEACIEGSLCELKAIATAIKARENEEFRRIAVKCLKSGVYLWSPKNSRRKTKISYKEAEALADQILSF